MQTTRDRPRSRTTADYNRTHTERRKTPKIGEWPFQRHAFRRAGDYALAGLKDRRGKDLYSFYCGPLRRSTELVHTAEPGTPSRRTSLPVGAKERKDVPLYSGVIKYFPDALIAIAELSRKGNDQHNPGKPLHWDRSKSGDELDAMMRHAFEAGTFDTDGVRHSTKTAWRALANLQKEIENSVH